jgi:hypothetical protein
MGVFYELTFTTTTGSERIAFQDVGDAQDVLDLIQQLQLGVARVQEKYIVPDLNVFCVPESSVNQQDRRIDQPS